MKKVAFLLFLYTLFSSPTSAKIGCMDNSDHLQSAYDTKDLHFVACTCPCTFMTDERGNLCLECFHYHEPEILVTASFYGAHNQNQAHLFIPEDPLIALKKFIIIKKALNSRLENKISSKKKR